MGEIYKITHIESGKIYIGQTTRTALIRWQEHLNESRWRQRSYFDKALRKHGESAFLIEVLESIENEQLDDREIYWIAFYDSTNSSKGYNIAVGGSRPPSRKGHKHTADAIEKNRQAHIGKTHVVTDDVKHHLSRQKTGVPLSEEHKQALAEAWKTRPPRKPEQSEKASQTSRGRINIKVYRILSPEGVEYITERGMNDFCREHGLYITGMNKVANGKQSDWHGWKVLPPREAN